MSIVKNKKFLLEKFEIRRICRSAEGTGFEQRLIAGNCYLMYPYKESRVGIFFKPVATEMGEFLL